MASSIDELPREVLHAGDMIMYCSIQYVAGDPRGQRSAIVVSVRPAKELPITIDSNELVSRTTLVKRVADRDGRHVNGVWRKLRAFKFEAGDVSIPSREKQFGAAVRNVVNDSVMNMRRHRSRDFDESQSRDN